MTARPISETAFPITHPDGSGVQYWGLSVREYLAAKTMQGLMATARTWPSEADLERVAQLSVVAADVLIRELAK